MRVIRFAADLRRLVPGAALLPILLTGALPGLAPPAGAGELAGGEVRILLEPARQCGSVPCEPPAGTLLLEPLAGRDDGASDSVHRVAIEGWGSHTLPIRPGTGWRLEVEAPGYWTGVQVLGPGNRERAVVLHPTGVLRITASPREGQAAPGPDLPADLGVAFTGAPVDLVPGHQPVAEDSRSAPVRGELRCPSDEPARWRCEVPAGRLDLRLHARGFASVHLWDVDLQPGSVRDLTGISLVPGGSVVGWLRPSPGLAVGADLEVMLVAADATPSTPPSRGRVRTVPVGERGLFQFTDLPAGFYRLQVEAEGWAPVDEGPVEVLAGLETRLREPLLLERPGSLAVCVDPARPPGQRRTGDTWFIELYGRAGDRRSPRNGFAGAGGCWYTSDVRPGPYTLVLGDRRPSIWQERNIEVRPGEQRIEVALDLVEIEGTVERGDDPVRARLHFQRLGTDAEGTPRERRIVFYTNPEGSFTGALPEAGEWSVQAALSARGGLIDLGSVEVDPGPRGVETLALRVPDAGLAGRVIDAAGEPVSDAVVWLDPLDGEDSGAAVSRSEARTGTDGKFSFEAARPGHYRANALHDGRAATAEVEVVEGVRIPLLTLMLEGLREVRGQVVGDSGGIAGARLVVFPDVTDAARRSVRTLTTASDGSFRLSVPAAAFQVRGVVLAAGYGARVVRIPVGEGGSPVLLPVDRLAGTLDLQFGEGLGPDSVLVVDGTPIWLAMLQEWARTARGLTRPDRWVLPSMGVGIYRICNRASECAEGFLHPGNTLVLQPVDP